MVDRLKPMVRKSSAGEQIKTFYEPAVEKIVKSKLDKFTYGSEVEVGGVLPGDEVDDKWD